MIDPFRAVDEYITISQLDAGMAQGEEEREMARINTMTLVNLITCNAVIRGNRFVSCLHPQSQRGRVFIIIIIWMGGWHNTTTCCC